MNTLFAGPWVGEFGWELFGWQSYLRSLSKQFDRTIISSRSSSHYLYKDFCTDFIPFESSLENTNFHTNSDSTLKIDSLSNVECTKRLMSNMLSGDQEFFSYGSKQDSYLFDIVFHARNLRIGLKSRRNWNIQSWNKIAEECSKRNYKVCCVGLSKYTDLVQPAVDKRDLDLENLANLLRNSRLVVGQSSGLMHYATLCKCPQLTWTQREDVKDRYCNKWNPFATEAKVVLSNDPDWKIIVQEIDNFMQRNK